jgi:hypothetical protein
MRTGAIVQTTIRRVYFAGRDPYAGAARMPMGPPQALRRPLQVIGSALGGQLHVPAGGGLRAPVKPVNQRCLHRLTGAWGAGLRDGRDGCV